jgi:hypothetical protein
MTLTTVKRNVETVALNWKKLQFTFMYTFLQILKILVYQDKADIIIEIVILIFI